ncbi:BrnT family toxin [Candidatus Thiosymbion oneisti]|uniref:BrnT family toxin n=1 Tax=Candidatus Thiosymbion oneisti TaxID=589554 RepID=UPI000B8007E6|nr:BrnT family toxin [Candidatus Thiosymbion oneisti]
MIVWDESKRQRNLKNHDLDFSGCEVVFDYPVVAWDDDREAYGEQRINLLGWLEGIVVHMTYVERGKHVQIISLRRAKKHEVRRYIQEISR